MKFYPYRKGGGKSCSILEKRKKVPTINHLFAVLLEVILRKKLMYFCPSISFALFIRRKGYYISPGSS